MASSHPLGHAARVEEKTWHLVVPYGIAIVGLVILMSTMHRGARYFVRQDCRLELTRAGLLPARAKLLRLRDPVRGSPRENRSFHSGSRDASILSRPPSRRAAAIAFIVRLAHSARADIRRTALCASEPSDGIDRPQSQLGNVAGSCASRRCVAPLTSAQISVRSITA